MEDAAVVAAEMAQTMAKAAADAKAAAATAKQAEEEAASKQAKTRPLPKSVDEQSDFEIQHGATLGEGGVKFVCIAKDD